MKLLKYIEEKMINLIFLFNVFFLCLIINIRYESQSYIGIAINQYIIFAFFNFFFIYSGRVFFIILFVMFYYSFKFLVLIFCFFFKRFFNIFLFLTLVLSFFDLFKFFFFLLLILDLIIARYYQDEEFNVNYMGFTLDGVRIMLTTKGSVRITYYFYDLILSNKMKDLDDYLDDMSDSPDYVYINRYNKYR